MALNINIIFINNTILKSQDTGHEKILSNKRSMGHKDISMTMRYAHLSEETKIEAIQVLNGLTSKNLSQNVTNSGFTEAATALTN